MSARLVLGFSESSSADETAADWGWSATRRRFETLFGGEYRLRTYIVHGAYVVRTATLLLTVQFVPVRYVAAVRTTEVGR